NRSAAGIAHRADQAVLSRNRPFGLLEQIDRREAHLRDRAAEVGHRNRSIGPARDRLLEASVLDDALRGSGRNKSSARQRGARHRQPNYWLASRLVFHACSVIDCWGVG